MSVGVARSWISLSKRAKALGEPALMLAPLRLELVDAQTYDTGAALHVYRPAAAASSPTANMLTR